MAKTTIVIDSEGLTATLGVTTIVDLVSAAFPLFGERSEINLTTIDHTKFEGKLLGYLQKMPDIVIVKKSSPAIDAALYSTASQALAIGYKIGKATSTVATFQVQLKNITPSTIERSPSDGVNVDLNFFITNMDADDDLAELGPAITTPE